MFGSLVELLMWVVQCCFVFCFKRKTAYEMRISDWSSDVCSSDLAGVGKTEIAKVLADTLGRRLVRLQCYEGLDVAAAVYEWNYPRQMVEIRVAEAAGEHDRARLSGDIFDERFLIERSEEHTSELQSLMRISYAVFCLIKKKNQHITLQ